MPSNGPSLSSRLQGRVGKTTRIKTDSSGNKIGGGTKITQETVEKVIGDENLSIVIAQNNTVRIILALDKAIANAMEEIGLVAEGAAKRLCPVDTGRLRNSITHAMLGPRDVAIGTNVEYGPYVHEGTHSRNGVPFLRDAAQNNQGRFEAILRKHLQNG